MFEDVRSPKINGMFETESINEDFSFSQNTLGSTVNFKTVISLYQIDPVRDILYHVLHGDWIFYTEMFQTVIWLTNGSRSNTYVSSENVMKPKF